MKNRPYFSIIVPTHNRVTLLTQTLDSILRQNFGSYEIVIVDNCSTDGTEEMIKSYNKKHKNINYIRNKENRERGYSRNIGLSMAKGTFATFLDADDLMNQTCLENAFRFIDSNKEVRFFKIAHGLYDPATEEIKRIASNIEINQHKALCKANFLSCIGVFIHKNIFSQIRFNEDPLFVGSEDYLVWFKPLALNRLYMYNTVELLVRDHANRSVYGHIYRNLDYQKRIVLETLAKDNILRHTYWKYKRYIVSNYAYHQALDMCYNRRVKKAVYFFLVAILNNPGMLATRRAYAVIKAAIK